MSVFSDAVTGIGDLIGGHSTVTNSTTTAPPVAKPMNMTPIYVGVGVVTLFAILMVIPFGGKSS